ERRAVARQTCRLDSTGARCDLDRRRRAAVNCDRVPANPLLGLLLEDHVLSGPGDRLDVRERAVAGLVVPELAHRAAARCVGTAGGVANHKRTLIAAGKPGAVQAVDTSGVTSGSAASRLFDSAAATTTSAGCRTARIADAAATLLRLHPERRS